MAEVAFSNAAEADLADIDEYSVALFGEDAADSYMLGFNEAFVRLGDFPEIGRLLLELGPDIRCLTHKRHRIFYTFSNDRVFIVRIVHHSMDEQRALKAAAGQ